MIDPAAFSYLKRVFIRKPFSSRLLSEEEAELIDPVVERKG